MFEFSEALCLISHRCDLHLFLRVLFLQDMYEIATQSDGTQLLSLVWHGRRELALCIEIMKGEA